MNQQTWISPGLIALGPTAAEAEGGKTSGTPDGGSSMFKS
jgi:hypothetical protein